MFKIKYLQHIVVNTVCVACSAHAQPYPNKPLRIVVGYTSGGAVDFTARLIGQKLSERLGQPVVVENRPGATTAIATERVAEAFSKPMPYPSVQKLAHKTHEPTSARCTRQRAKPARVVFVKIPQ